MTVYIIYIIVRAMFLFCGLVDMYYVTAKNDFISGWGRFRRFDCYLCVLCKTRHEASVVSENAKLRSDLSQIKIHNKIPFSLTADTLGVGRHILGHYIVKVVNKKSDPKLFMPNYFQYKKKYKVVNK